MRHSVIKKPFKSGGSTAVRIPKSMHLELTDELEISSPAEGVIVMKVINRDWENKMRNLITETKDSSLWDDSATPSRTSQHREIDQW